MQNNEISLIENIYKLDQKLRTNKVIPIKTVREFDKFTTHFTKLIITKYGIENIPINVASKFFTLLNHTIDLSFLENIIKSNPKNFDMTDIAIAIDRILLSKGKLQKYGTIVETTKTNNIYKTTPISIKSIQNVNKLRKSIGLDSLEDYINRAEKIYKEIERE